MQNTEVTTFGPLIARDRGMVDALGLARKASRENVPVLLEGESGTGKQALAFAIHTESSLKRSQFCVIGCSADAPTALKSMLVGSKPILVVRYGQKTGSELRLERAGTLYIDEIRLMSPTVQFGLLSLLDELRSSPCGIQRETKPHLRVITSTTGDIQKACKEGLVRSDLFYAMSVIHITLLPLRERLDDLVPLAKHFLQVAMQKHSKSHRTFSSKCLTEMAKYGWPGNLDELKSRIERAVILSSAMAISHRELGLPSLTREIGIKLADRKLELEKQNLHTALEAAGGYVARAARILGLSRQNCYRLVKKHNMSLDDFRNKRIADLDN
ncbi:sigma-54-dependent Fis family transcriptional regulator [bacterium]|nr:sigma-54-dependent Fis family transcriptional regulator [bacterium]